MESKITKEYKKALELAQQGGDVVICVEVRGSMREKPIVLLSSEIHAGKKINMER